MSIVDDNFDKHMKDIFDIEDDEEIKEEFDIPENITLKSEPELTDEEEEALQQEDEKAKDELVKSVTSDVELQEEINPKKDETKNLKKVLKDAGEDAVLNNLQKSGVITQRRVNHIFNNMGKNYKVARRNHAKIMFHGLEALETMKEIALSSLEGVSSARDVARIYEVYASLIKSVGDNNTKMIELDNQVFNMSGVADMIKSQNMVDRTTAIETVKSKLKPIKAAAPKIIRNEEFTDDSSKGKGKEQKSWVLNTKDLVKIINETEDKRGKK